MKDKKFKFKYTKGHIWAILHMIGQSQFVFKEAVSCSDVAAWMNVTKPTARKYLKDMTEIGLLNTYREKYKTNATIDRWYLNSSILDAYARDEFKPAYRVYAQRVMGVILQDD